MVRSTATGMVRNRHLPGQGGINTKIIHVNRVPATTPVKQVHLVHFPVSSDVALRVASGLKTLMNRKPKPLNNIPLQRPCTPFPTPADIIEDANKDSPTEPYRLLAPLRHGPASICLSSNIPLSWDKPRVWVQIDQRVVDNDAGKKAVPAVE